MSAIAMRSTWLNLLQYSVNTKKPCRTLEVERVLLVFLLGPAAPESALDLVEVLVVVHGHAVVHKVADALQESVRALMKKQKILRGD